MIEVQLQDIPVETWKRATAHQDALQRELDILRGSLPSEAAPNRLKAITDDLDLRYPRIGDPFVRELHAAADRGEKSIDLTMKVPEEVGEVAREVCDVMTEVDEYCRAGDALLTIVTPPDLVEFREWFLGEVTRQIDGLPPTRWSDYNRSSGPAVAPDRSAESVTETKEGRIAFRGELDLATASELQSLLVEEKSNGFGSLQVDLTGVTFIDSVGLSLLVSAHNRLTEEGGRLRILLPERLRPLFRLSGLSDLLDLEFPGDH